jgi:hypothetical protein
MRLFNLKRVRQLSLPAGWLLLLLERTPALRLVSIAAESVAPTRIVALLKSAFAGVASLGAVHSLAGATEFVVSTNNVFGTVGTPITSIAFIVTGAAIPAGSYRISGQIPPGITLVNANGNGVLNADRGIISGTPTVAGTYIVSIMAYQLANASGDAYGPTEIGFIITSTASAAPGISTQPASQSVNAGASVTLSVVATGSPAPTYQWRKNGVLVSGATGASLTLANAQASDAGAYTVTVTNLAGIVTSSPAVLTVNAVGPAITAQPQSQNLSVGASATLSVSAAGSGLSYQWRKDGTAIAGATASTYPLGAVAAATMGFYTATVTSASATVESAVAIITVNSGGTSRLVNVSTRGYIPAGGSLTPGFVLQGNATKSVVIRGIGPTLGAFGVGDTLLDPTMEVIPLGSAIPVASNDNWEGTTALRAAFAQVGAFPLSAATSADASVQTSLTASGASGYTVRITSKSPSAAGIALAEVYDQEAITSPVRLVNVSTSGFVGTGDKALVPGFFVGGTAPKRLLIRAVGPGLTQFGVTGVLVDPQLSITPLGKDFAVVANDNWGGSAALQTAFTQAAAFALPTGSNDAAVALQLPPGGYTVVVSGVGGTSGTALVEIYDLDP